MNKIRSKPTCARRNMRGFTAIELMVVLIVAVSAMALGGDAVNNYLNGLEYQSAAGHAKQVQEAARKYVEANSAAIQAATTATTPADITVTMLKNTGYLANSVADTNVFSQSYTIRVLQPVAQKLDVLLVTTGGTVIPELGLRRIAQIIGAEGGYVGSLAPTIANGSYGGWSIPLTTLPGSSYGVNPGAGHLAVSMFLMNNGAASGDYVYRNAVAGKPELNKMTTPLTVPKIIPTAIVVEDAVCSDPPGTMATDATGTIYVCK